MQSLRALVRETEPARLRPQLGSGAVDLAQLLPELRELYPDLPEPPAPESEGARFRLFEAVSALLTNAAGAQPLVLVLDDVHAADEPSLLLLEFVARTIGDARLLVVCAYRDVDPMLRDPLIGTLAQLVREPKTTHLALAGLSEEDVGGYIELAAAAASPPELVEAIHTETEGNALFMTEVVRLLEAEGRLGDAAARLDIPAGVRAVIARRVGRLPEHCRSTLVLAAVLGREFDLQALAQLRRLELDQLLRVLDDAMAERVITEVPGSHGRLRFGHALIRDTLYDDLTASRRVQLHREAGDALKFVYGGNLAPHLAELAHHYYEAASAGGAAETAIEYAHRAGDRAAAQLAYEEAARLYQMALTLAETGITRCELLLALGDVLARAGDTYASKESFREAAERAESLGLPEHLSHAALGYGGRMIWDVSRDDKHLTHLLERALATLGEDDSPLRVQLLARLAGGPMRDASYAPEPRRSLSGEALEIARRIRSPGTLAYAISGYAGARLGPEFTHEQLTLATDLIEAAMEAGDLERAVEGHEFRMSGLIELGDLRRAKDDLAVMDELAESLRQPSQRWLVAVYRALVALLEGRLAEAEIAITGAHRLGERTHEWSAPVTYGLQLYALRREQGRLGDVEDLVRHGVGEYSTYPIWRCALAQLAADLEQAAEAREVFEALAADQFATLPFDETWVVNCGLLAEVAHDFRDSARASVLYDGLLPYSDRIALAWPEFSTGAVSRYLGLLATTTDRLDDAERHFEDAIALHERIGARTWLARTQVDLAGMLLIRRGSGDPKRARALTATARVAAKELGMVLRTGLERALEAEQELLVVEPARVPVQVTVRADDAVAREDDRDRVRGARPTGRAWRTGVAGPCRELAVTDRLAVRDPEHLLERPQPEAASERPVERHRELPSRAGEVLLELVPGRRDRRLVLDDVVADPAPKLVTHALRILRRKSDPNEARLGRRQREPAHRGLDVGAGDRHAASSSSAEVAFQRWSAA